MGPTSPRRITINDRSAVQPEPNPSTVSASPSRCRARLPSASPPTTNNPTASQAAQRCGQPAQQPHGARERQDGKRRDDHGAGRGAAVNLADGAGRRTVSVPTESRRASSMTALAGGDEISKQGQLAEHEDSRAQHRKGGEGTGTFTEPQTKIKYRLQTQLLQGESLCRLR